MYSKCFFELLGELSLYILPVRFSTLITKLFDKVYTGRVRGQFSKVGECLTCEYCIKLWHPQYIEIGNNVYIFSKTILAAHMQSEKHGIIRVGNSVTLGEYTHITSLFSITIGDNVLFGRRVTVTDNSHGFSTISDMKLAPSSRVLKSKGPVVIERNVWIGDNVVILPNVTIGEGSIIGANTVVTIDIPAFSVAVGNPVRVVKKWHSGTEGKLFNVGDESV